MADHGFEWRAAAPEDQGLSSPKLERVRSALADRATKALLVIRNDRIVCEWYADGHAPQKKHYTASMAKAIVGGLSLMLAMDDGLVSPDDPACNYVPSWADDPRKSKITVRHLATHTSGIEDAELSDAERRQVLVSGTPLGDPHMDLPGWKGAFWRREPDPFTISRDQAPAVFEPGTAYSYSNPGIAMLAWVVTAAIQSGRHKDIRTLLAERIYRPIGIGEGEWSVGYEQTYEVDGLPLVGTWGGGRFTARAVARIGRLMLRAGDWDGRRLMSAEVVKRAVAPAATHGPKQGHVAGLGWWTHRPAVAGPIPPGGFAGAGAGAQILLVIPDRQTVVVRNGSLAGQDIWDEMGRYLIAPLMDAYEPER